MLVEVFCTWRTGQCCCFLQLVLVYSCDRQLYHQHGPSKAVICLQLMYGSVDTAVRLSISLRRLAPSPRSRWMSLVPTHCCAFQVKPAQ